MVPLAPNRLMPAMPTPVDGPHPTMSAGPAARGGNGEPRPGIGRALVGRSATLTGFGSAEKHDVWQIPSGAANSAEVWAPEIHRLGGPRSRPARPGRRRVHPGRLAQGPVPRSQYAVPLDTHRS